MPELLGIVGLIALVIGGVFVLKRHAAQRKIKNTACQLVLEHLGVMYIKGDHVKAHSEGSRVAKNRECIGVVESSPFFKDDDRKIAITVRSDRDSNPYIKPILKLDEEGKWQRTSITVTHVSARKPVSR